jgi:hypothetical protein
MDSIRFSGESENALVVVHNWNALKDHRAVCCCIAVETDGGDKKGRPGRKRMASQKRENYAQRNTGKH